MTTPAPMWPVQTNADFTSEPGSPKDLKDPPLTVAERIVERKKLTNPPYGYPAIPAAPVWVGPAQVTHRSLLLFWDPGDAVDVASTRIYVAQVPAPPAPPPAQPTEPSLRRPVTSSSTPDPADPSIFAGRRWWPRCRRRPRARR